MPPESDTLRCAYPERELRIAEDALGHLAATHAAAWEAHLEACPACAEDVVRAMAARQAVPPPAAPLGHPATPAARSRLWGWSAAALLLVGLAAASWVALHRARLERRRQEYAEVWALLAKAEVRAARRLSDRLAAADPSFAHLAQAGVVRRREGDLPGSIDALRQALRAGEAIAPDGTAIAPWSVWSELGQSLVERGADGDEAEVERIVRDEIPATSATSINHRILLRCAIVRRLAFRLRDAQGGARALALAEAEHPAYRAAWEREHGSPADNHYLLHTKFAWVQTLEADSEKGRELGIQIQAAHEAAAHVQEGTPAAASYRADALEFRAQAELLARRRGDSGDLVQAATWLAQARRLRTEAGNLEGVAQGRMAEAYLALLQGQAGEALALAREAAAVTETSGVREAHIEALLVLAQAAAAAGDPDAAERALREASGLRAEGSAPPSPILAAIRATLLPPGPERAEALDDLERQQRLAPWADWRRVAAEARAAALAGKHVPVFPLDASRLQ